jgi:hypothetical protein
MSDRDPNQDPTKPKQQFDDQDGVGNGEDSADTSKVPSHTGVGKVETGQPSGGGSDNGLSGNIGAGGVLLESDNGGENKDKTKEKEREEVGDVGTGSVALGDDADRVKKLMLGQNPNLMFVAQNTPFGGVLGPGPWMAVNSGAVPPGLQWSLDPLSGFWSIAPQGTRMLVQPGQQYIGASSVGVLNPFQVQPALSLQGITAGSQQLQQVQVQNQQGVDRHNGSGLKVFVLPPVPRKGSNYGPFQGMMLSVS